MPHKDDEARKQYLRDWRQRKLASADPVERAKAERNRENDRENSRQYRERNKDNPEFKAAKAASAKKWQSENLEHMREYGKKYRADNKERIAELSRAKYVRYKENVFEKLGKRKCDCGCAGSDDIRALHLHHPNEDGGQHRRENGQMLWGWASRQPAEVVRELELLCANCHAKRHRSDKSESELSPAGRSIRRLKLKVRDQYGNCCAMCDHREDLHLDHIEGGGKQERAANKRGYREALESPEKFRLLCPNHNFIVASTEYRKGGDPSEPPPLESVSDEP